MGELASESQRGIPGCAATLSVNVREIIAAPSIASDVTMLWSALKREIASEDIGPEALADLARLGVRSPSDIHSIEVCVTAAPGGRREFRERDRTGFLVRGPFTQGALKPLVIKWADKEIDDTGNHHGIEFVELKDGTLLAQRADGSLVIARRYSTLTALIDAPSSPSHAQHAVAVRVTDAARVFGARGDFPSDAVRSMELDLNATLDRIHFSVVATSDAAADDMVVWMQELSTQMLKDYYLRRDADAIEQAVARAIAGAEITKNQRTVTFVATLPESLPDLTLQRLAQEL